MEKINEIELKKFLVEAKKSTYASGNPAKKLDDGSEEFTYERGIWKYRDRYFAKDPRHFGGGEVVWRDNKPFWMMNYFGRAREHSDESVIGVRHNITIEEIYENLKKALLKIPEEAPFRGPKTIKLADYLQYTNKFIGDINSFQGKENMYFWDAEVYFLTYHGGLLNVRN